MIDPNSVHPQYSSHAAPGEPLSRRTFSIASLLLIMTLTAFLLGMVIWEIGTGIVLVIIALPALFRTVQIVNRLKARGATMTLVEKSLAFLRSFVLTAIIAGIAGGLFIGTVYVLAESVHPSILIPGSILAIVVSGLIGAALIRRFW